MTLQQDITDLRSEGLSYSKIAMQLECSKSTVCYYLGDNQKAKTDARRKRNPSHPLQKKIWAYTRDSGEVILMEDVVKRFGNKPRCYLTMEPIDLNDPTAYSLDHIVPRSRGGLSTLDNMGLLSSDANKAKHNMSLDDFYDMCKLIVTNETKTKRLLKNTK